MFWRSKKDIILDCYTSNPFAYNYAKINYGYHYIPDWWKKTPPKRTNDNKDYHTIRKCPGIIEYYKKGIVLPLWAELRLLLLDKNEEESYRYISSHSQLIATSHDQKQFEGFAKDNGYSLKLESPWHIRCKEPIEFTMSQPIWSQRDTLFSLSLLPGIVEFKTQTSTNLNYFFEKRDNRVEINLEPLTPLAIFHPHTDRKIILKYHYVENKDTFNEMFTSDFGMFLNRDGTRFERQLQRKKDFIDKVDRIDNKEFKL
tara:strand:+ start:612 stop:1382 length:771 start_codon:yes stop_codon:yes gene_type:complete